MSRGRWLQLAVAAALVATLALAVPWARRLHGDGPRALAVTGTVEALQVDVSAKLSGRIVTLAVREGERVKAGQELVRLDAEELAAESQRADAALRAAEASLRDLQAGAPSRTSCVSCAGSCSRASASSTCGRSCCLSSSSAPSSSPSPCSVSASSWTDRVG